MSQGKSGGLEGVVVADTTLSEVDGEKGRLIVAGRDIEQLTGRVSFEDLCVLLWRPAPGGELPTADERAALRRDLGRARAVAFSSLPRLGDALDHADGM